tara:strand:+ start:54 stop:677 length:624 start_codon:yes stop_codon:yes gene_type:complete
MIEKINIKKIKPNSGNPRVIKDYKFKKLVRSIQNFPEMLDLRPIVVNEDKVVLGGNMRLRACQEAGLEEVPIIVAKDLNEAKQKEFVVKDNLNYGEWDWDMLANEFDLMELDTYGLDLNPTLFNDKDEESIKGVTDEKFNDYTIYFTNEQELDIWYEFLKKIRNDFKDQENVSARILRYIAEVYMDNKMTDSQRILKFIEYDVDGNS